MIDLKQQIARFVLCGILLILSTVAGAKGVVSDIRVWRSQERVRVVLDLSIKPDYRSFSLVNPARFVVDFNNLDIVAPVPGKKAKGALIREIRLGKPKKGISRLVVDLHDAAKVKTSYIAASAGFKPRLVIDFYSLASSGGSTKAPLTNKPALTSPKNNEETADTLKLKPVKTNQVKDFIVVIDAGHGGVDSGARGRRAREKQVVLQIAKRLEKKINAVPRMKAILTRKGDYFLSLRKRTLLARKQKADLFVSIHADAFRKKSARGSSVFVLSLKGASSEEAKWLAQKENAADLVGGVVLSTYEPDVRKLLLDLSMGDTIHQSIIFAKEVLSELKKIGKVHSRKVERAGFVVLKSPDIPSILVETAFITNPNEEALLRSAKHQNKLADALFNGIRRYAKKARRDP